MGRRDPTSYHGSWTNPVDTLRERIHSYRDMNTVISALHPHPNRSNKHCRTLKYGEAQASANFSQNGYGALYNYGLMSGECQFYLLAVSMKTSPSSAVNCPQLDTICSCVPSYGIRSGLLINEPMESEPAACRPGMRDFGGVHWFLNLAMAIQRQD